MATGKAQDVELMDNMMAFLHELSILDDPPVQLAVRIHERNIQVTFPDGRVVALVLYGPRGKE